MHTDTSQYDAQGDDNIQDLVRIDIILPRSCLENHIVERLRSAGNHSEEELRMIGLVEHLVERHGHLYRGDLLYPLHYSMDCEGEFEELPLKVLHEAVQELIEVYSRPYVPEVAA
ncbi:hypothetical protein [Celeribacter sp.]|uniref:hypothetical protein n=1 Tax=Celeribacter sp. TaxID=1890673 RepID=UPI003A9057B9